MRLLIIGINFYPELTGIGKYTGEMAAYLAAQGHEIRAITAPPYYPQWKISRPYSGWRYQQEQWAGVDVYRCPLWVPKRPSGLKRLIHLSSFALSSLLALAGQFFWKPDLVFCVAPALSVAPFALLAARLSGAKAWLHMQDFEVDAALDLGLLPSWIRRMALALEKNLLRRFDCISTISEAMIAKLLHKGVRSERSVLFPNWVDTNLIYPLETSPMRNEMGIREDRIVVLYSGNMGVKQGLEILIDAAKLLANEPDIQFVLCGEGAIRSQLERVAQGLRNVHFYSLQPLERLNHLLNLADIHVLPQRADAADLVMPSKLSGMLASGKPVVGTATETSALGKTLRDVGILVPPESAAQLAGAIRRLAEDPKLRADLGRKGRVWAVRNWSKEKVLARLESEIQNVVQS